MAHKWNVFHHFKHPASHTLRKTSRRKTTTNRSKKIRHFESLEIFEGWKTLLFQ